MTRDTADRPGASSSDQPAEPDGGVTKKTDEPSGGGVVASLERRAPALLLAGGGLLTVFAANTWLGAFAGTSYPVVHDVVGPAGFLVGMLGLLGLSPVLAERLGTVARAAAAVAVIPALGWAVIVVGSVGAELGVLPGGGPIVGLVSILTIATTTLTYALFGALNLRGGTDSRLVGVFLLVPAVMFVLLLARVAPPFVVDAGHVVGHLGAGLALWSAGLAADRAEPAADAAS